MMRRKNISLLLVITLLLQIIFIPIINADDLKPIDTVNEHIDDVQDDEYKEIEFNEEMEDEDENLGTEDEEGGDLKGIEIRDEETIQDDLEAESQMKNEMLEADYRLNLSDENIVSVESEDELKNALNNENIDKIIILNEIYISEEIVLNRDLLLRGENESARLVSNIVEVNDSLIRIDGGKIEIEHLIIDGNSKNRCIKAEEGSSLKLTNVVVENGNYGGENYHYSKSDGGGIYAEIPLTIIDSEVINNISIGSYGGGIFAESSLYIENSTISNNSVIYEGGGIYLSGDGEIVGSIISNNKARLNGAGIYIDKGNIIIKDTKIVENGDINVSEGAPQNIAKPINGGGLCTGNNMDGDRIINVDIENSEFADNVSKERGGGIYFYNNGGSLNIKDTEFNENRSYTQGGGAIRVDAGNEVNIDNTEFNRNISCRGAAIDSMNNDSFNITNSRFKENETVPYFSRGHGIASCIRIDKSNVYIDNTEFIENRTYGYSEARGGVIYISEGGLVIDNSSFIGNILESGNEDRKQDNTGGVISMVSGYSGSDGPINTINMDIKNSEFINNSAANGGVFHIQDSKGEKKFENLYCKGNSATNGGVFNHTGGTISIIGGIYKNNEAINGGVINISEGIAYINGGEYEDNEAVYGGVINISDGIAYINGGEYEDNEAVYGGVIYSDVINSGGLVIKENAKFLNNHASRISGFLYVETIWRNGKRYDYGYVYTTIDNSVVVENNTIEDQLRFINGFEEDKYKEYEATITEKITLNNQSRGDSPINNIDINMLDYEYYLAYENPGYLDGYLDWEVFRKDDEGYIKEKYSPSYVVEDAREVDGKLENNKWTLLEWDKIARFDEDKTKIGESDISDINEKIDIESNDIFLEGLWNLETTQEDKPVPPSPETPDETPETPETPVYPIGPISPEIVVRPEEVKPEDVDDMEVTLPDMDFDKKLGLLDKLNAEDHFQYIEGYEDNTVRPEANITREEAAAILFRILNPSYRDSIRKDHSDFVDVKEDRWSSKHIGTLANAGIIEGYPDGEFKKENAITRAEVAAMVIRFSGESDGLENRFTDIDGHWAANYINNIANNKWVEGYPNGEFKPDQYISRAEFVTIINKMLNRNTSLENMLDGRRVFEDLYENTWYYEAMEEAINGHTYEIINGIERWKELKDFVIEM